MAGFHDFEATLLNGETVAMRTYAGKFVLVVNTASACGFTPQYAGLQQLYEKHQDNLVILGFPCNQFGGQESGSAEDIAEFCQINYGVSFPMFSKVEVNGSNAHPLFEFLKQSLPGTFGKAIKWNFTKFLIGPDGKPLKRFATNTDPQKIGAFVERLLARV